MQHPSHHPQWSSSNPPNGSSNPPTNPNHYPPYSSQPPSNGNGGIFRKPHNASEHYMGGAPQAVQGWNGPPGYYQPHPSQNQQQQQQPPTHGHYYNNQPPPQHGHPGPPPSNNQWGHHQHYPSQHGAGPLPPNSHSSIPPNQPGHPAPWDSLSQQMVPPNDSRSSPHDNVYHSHPPPHPSSHGQPPHPNSHPANYSRHGPPPPHVNDSRSQYHAPPPHHSTGILPPDLKRKAPHISAPPQHNHPSSMPPPSHHQFHHNLPPTPGALPPQGHPSYTMTSPGFHPDLRSAHSTASRTPGVGTPMHGGPLTSPGGTMYDDDKGRGSYKCGRCGVPKKGHVCPYQPKVKRRPEDPAPVMKCISTQVEMDEFMTLRRLNLEIQGFPESYAAEPMDMVGADVHSHPSQVLISDTNSGAPTYSLPVARAPEQGHPTSVPSLASMNSHPQPPNTNSPPKETSYSDQPSILPPTSTPTSKSEKDECIDTDASLALKSEEASEPESEAAPTDSVKSEEIQTQNDESKETESNSEQDETTESNNESESDSNKRAKVE